MKKICYLLLFFMIVFMMESCDYGANHRTNFFVEGEFVGVNSRNEDEEFYFTVKSITKDEYDAANGINVVFDDFKKEYFSLELYYIIESNKTYLEFKNLKSYGTPLRYEDDHKNYIIPLLNTHNNKDYNTPKCVYNLDLNYKMDNHTYAVVHLERKDKNYV